MKYDLFFLSRVFRRRPAVHPRAHWAERAIQAASRFSITGALVFLVVLIAVQVGRSLGWWK